MNASSTSFAGPLVGWLTDYYLLATLLLLVAFVGWRWVRQPAHRIMVAWMVMLELIVLAVVCALPSWPRVSLIATTSQQAAAELPALSDQGLVARPPIPLAPVAKEDPVSAAPLKPEVSESVASPAPPEPHLAWIGVIAVAYLAGAALVGLWLCWGVAATTWLRKRAQPAAEPLRAELSQVVGGDGRPPRLLVSSHVVNAVALSVLRPTIVLPGGLAESGPPHALRAVLSHEWAHIRNRDLWLLALGRCLLGVLFAHPLFWWLRRAIRGDQELLADAVAAGDNRQAYAEELLRLIRKTAHPSPIALSAAVSIWEGSSQLSRRIAMLLDETFRVEPAGSRCWQCRALAPLVLLGAACSLVTFQPGRSAGEQADRVAATQSGPENGAGQVDGRPAEGVKEQGNQRPAKESSPDGAAKPKVISSFVVTGTLSYSTSVTGPSDLIVLPGYELLMQREVLKELSITAEQKKRLHEIEAKYHASTSNFHRDKRDLPQDELRVAWTRWELEKRKDIRKQVEEALKPQQTKALKELAFREGAFLRLSDPKVLEQLGMTKEQEGRLLSLHGEIGRWSQRYSQEAIDKTLAVLNAQQRAQLRVEALGPEGPEVHAELVVDVEGETEPVHVPSMFPYPDLSEQVVRKELGLSAIQQNRVRDILGESSNVTEKLVEELQKLAPEERKMRQIKTFTFAGGSTSSGGNLSREEEEKHQAEFEEKLKKERRKRQAEFEKRPMVKACIELRKRFEAVLTPEQLVGYQDMAVRNVALGALQDPLVQHKIGASDQQKAALQRLSEESLVTYRQFTREMGEKMLKVLAPPQQEKLRQAIDQRQW